MTKVSIVTKYLYILNINLVPEMAPIKVNEKLFNDLCHKITESTFENTFLRSVFRKNAGMAFMKSENLLEIRLRNQITIFRKKKQIYDGNSNVYEFQGAVDGKITVTLIVKELEWNEYKEERKILRDIQDDCQDDGICRTCPLVYARVINKPVKEHFYIIMPKATGSLLDLKEIIQTNIQSKKHYTNLVFRIVESVRKSFVCLYKKENRFYSDLKLENVLFTCNKDKTISLVLGDVGSLSDEFLSTYPTPEIKSGTLSSTINFSKTGSWFLGHLFLTMCMKDVGEQLYSHELMESLDPYGEYDMEQVAKSKRDVCRNRKILSSALWMGVLDNHFQMSFGKTGLSSYLHFDARKRPSVYRRILDDKVYRFKSQAKYEKRNRQILSQGNGIQNL